MDLNQWEIYYSEWVFWFEKIDTLIGDTIRLRIKLKFYRIILVKDSGI